MTTYYVATLARYVLVEAASDAEARYRGHDALLELYAKDGAVDDVSINIRTVRPATEDEIQFMNWHRKSEAEHG